MALSSVCALESSSQSMRPVAILRRDTLRWALSHHTSIRAARDRLDLVALKPTWAAPTMPRIARIEQIPCSGCSSIVLCIMLHIEHRALLTLEQSSDFDAHQLAFGDIFRHAPPRSRCVACAYARLQPQRCHIHARDHLLFRHLPAAQG